MRSRSYLPTEALAVTVLMGLISVAAFPELAIADSVSAEAALGHLVGQTKDSNCDCLDSTKTRTGMESKKLQASVLQRLKEAKASHYDVQSGDTLDSIIKGQLSNNPVHKDILRQAIVLANPKAFRRNNPHWLYANRKIKLPEVADIHRAVFKQSAIQDELLNRIESKKSWIRYP
jgi:nucleoid-associated protein YgaU